MARFKIFDPNAEYVTVEQLFDWVRAHPLPDGRCVPMFLWGGSGVGKTQIIKNYCRERGIGLKTYAPAHDVDGQGIVGIPEVDPDTGATVHRVPEHIPTEADGPAGIWFIDEINRGNEAVLAGLMEPIGEGTISQSHWTLPAGWVIVAAANPREMGYQVAELDEAMLNRAIHYAPGWDGPSWAAWAEETGVQPDIIDFALADETHVNSGEHQLPQELQEKLKPSPRTLTYLASLYEPGMPEGLLEVITDGLLNRAAAERFRAWATSKDRAFTFQQAAEDGDGDQPLLRLASGWVAVARDSERPIAEREHAKQCLRASLLRIVGGLTRLAYEPTPEGAQEYGPSDLLAQQFAKFFAIMPPDLADEVWDVVKRSAPLWSPILRENAQRWQEYWLSQQPTA